jgi:hypothetical protein
LEGAKTATDPRVVWVLEMQKPRPIPPTEPWTNSSKIFLPVKAQFWLPQSCTTQSQNHLQQL